MFMYTGFMSSEIQYVNLDLVQAVQFLEKEKTIVFVMNNNNRITFKIAVDDTQNTMWKDAVAEIEEYLTAGE